MQREYYGMPLPPYAPVQQQSNTDLASYLEQLLSNLQDLHNSEDPTAKELIRKGSGGVMKKPNPYYNQIQALRSVIPNFNKYLQNSRQNFIQDYNRGLIR